MTCELHRCREEHDEAKKFALFDAEVCELLMRAKDLAEAPGMTEAYMNARNRLCEQARKMFNPEQYKWEKENE